MPKITAILPNHHKIEYELKSGVNRLGRNPKNDLQLLEASVSGFHCELFQNSGTIVVKDLGSRNGTYIDGKKIDRSILLPGHVLQLGKVEIRLEGAVAHVAVPQMETKAEEWTAFLPDGSAACLNHRDVMATLRCKKCERTWCESCVRILKKLDGSLLYFCNECSGPCLKIEDNTMIIKKKSWMQSIFGKKTSSSRR
ncbi:MAG: FHA domain-containing protein [Verrucomicrobiota bacterium]|nr:FHA domain-containing protein [Verrucomicrobiota bacterium]